MKHQIKFGVPSGFKDLDCITAGWQPGDLIIIASRPSMGKTAFATSMARNMVFDYNKRVVFFSLEMSSKQIAKRLIVSETELDSAKIRIGELQPCEKERLDTKTRELQNAPFYIDGAPALSISEFRDKCEQMIKYNKVDIAIIDYLQLMSWTGNPKENREQEVSSISRSLNAIAKELNIPVIVLSQLSRDAETRASMQDKRPILTGLRESESIEQDADIVCFIHRPEYYGFHEDEDGNSLDGVAEIIIAKHRNGATSDFRIKFKKQFAKFTEYAPNDKA